MELFLLASVALNVNLSPPDFLIFLHQPNNYIEGRLLMGGFVELQGSATSLQNSVQSVTVSMTMG